MRIDAGMLPPKLQKLENCRRELIDLEERANQLSDYEKAAQHRTERLRLEAERAAEHQAIAPATGPDLAVNEPDIAALVANWTGIPVGQIMEGEAERLLNLEARLHQRVIGQDEAINAVADTIRRARSGLNDPRRPFGSFIFLGPTGVGKTELSRALAEFLFNDEDSMVRLDMSEYGERTRCPGSSARPPATWATTTPDNSPRPSAAAPTGSSCLTRSKKPTPTCSTSCCKSWRMAASPTDRAAPWIFATP